MTDSPDLQGPRPSHRPVLVVVALWLVMLVTSSQTLIVALILPQIGEALDVADAALGTLVAAYAVSLGALALASGPVSDRVGRKTILVVGSLVMTGALLLHGSATGYGAFLAVRCLTGMAGGLLVGAAQSYIGDYFPYARRGWAAGWVMSGIAAGQVLGVPAGVLMAGAWSFAAPFYVFGALMALAASLVVALLPDVRGARSQEPLGISQAARTYGRILSRRPCATMLLASGSMMLGQALFVVYLPTWLARTFSAGPGTLASLFLLGGATSILVGPRAGALSDLAGRRHMIAGASAGLALLMACSTIVITELWIVYPLFMIAMALVAMRLSPLTALLTALVDEAHRGSLMSLNVALGQIAFGVGSAAAGRLYGGIGYWANTAAGAVCLAAMATLVWLRVAEPTPA